MKPAAQALTGEGAAVPCLRVITAREPSMDWGALVGRRRHSFDSVAQRWLKLRAHKVEASSIVTYSRMLNLYLTPKFGARPVATITKAMMMDFAGELLERGLSPATVRLCFNVAQMVFDFAEDLALLVGNPARRVTEKVLPKDREDARPAKAMTREQLAIFLTVARLTEPAYYHALLLMARTGLRIGECLALTWPDVDLANRRLTVRRSKNGRPRTLPLTGDMSEMLGAMKGTGGLVFAKDGLPHKPQSLRRSVKRICVRAGMSAHWHPHNLRHSVASILDQEGADIGFISRALGHSDLKTTRGYAHNLPATGWAVMDRLMSAVPVGLPAESAPAAGPLAGRSSSCPADDAPTVPERDPGVAS